MSTDLQLPVQWLPSADYWRQVLAASVHWHSETLTLFGRKRLVPRQVAWFGDAGLCYRYSGIDHPSSGWPGVIRPLREAVNELVGVAHNFVLLNRYRDGNDSMGWHADDEPLLLGNVCSVSLGASRRLLFERADGQRGAMVLTHGSVVTIPRAWRHCVPKTRKPTDERINLSFRCLV